MPELPEIEVLKRALVPLVQNKVLLELKFLRGNLRFPIPRKKLAQELTGTTIERVTRRGKYLLFHAPNGAMFWHLGMSGRIIRYPGMEPVEKHTHAMFRFKPGVCLHFIDPRRFGSILWAPKNKGHSLLAHMGLEPLAATTTAKALKERARGCRGSIKTFLMNSRRLAGIGNIYACESLFAVSMNPKRPADQLSLNDWERLLAALQQILKQSIAAGGTTLRDFFGPDGSAGYFALNLTVYGKEKQPCPNCGAAIVRMVQCGRSTFFCKVCQV